LSLGPAARTELTLAGPDGQPIAEASVVPTRVREMPVPDALGLIAQKLAATDKAGATELLKTAYRELDHLAERGRTSTLLHGNAQIASGLLPIVEEVVPERLPEFLARALSLREPWLDAGNGVGKDQQFAIDPIGTLDMGLNVADKVKTVKAGEDVSLQPLLYTGDGLLINVAYRGTPVAPAAQENLVAVTTLASTDGQTLGTAHSGFA
jgi:hypothetical protein